MAQALPIAKLAGLLIKTLSKPVSKRIKHEFAQYETSQRLLVGIGQASHQLSSRMTIIASGYKVRSIKPLEHEKALSSGADLVGESFVLMVSAGIVVYEYDRSSKKEEKKRQNLLEEQAALDAKLLSLDARLKALEKVVKSNSQSILSFSGAKYEEPTDVVPIVPNTKEATKREKDPGKSKIESTEQPEKQKKRSWFGIF
mmetsp:Transcript_19178/g.26587  ORF Transcript_19178/g.26587 Transcript_19178/m.26587 type:complete len:200 (-) Transcript_19178:1071-1670(-)